MCGLVEIIGAPDEASLRIVPEPEILDVCVADREHVRCLREIGTQKRRRLRPAPARRAQELERALAHLGVLLVEIVFDEIVAEGLAEERLVACDRCLIESGSMGELRAMNERKACASRGGARGRYSSGKRSFLARSSGSRAYAAFGAASAGRIVSSRRSS